MSGRSTLSVGEAAPDFILLSRLREATRLSDFRGKETVVFFFYPEDDTPGCAAGSRAFRDPHGAFAGAAEQLEASRRGARAPPRPPPSLTPPGEAL